MQVADGVVLCGTVSRKFQAETEPHVSRTAAVLWPLAALALLVYANLPQPASVAGFIMIAGAPLTFAAWVGDELTFSWPRLAADVVFALATVAGVAYVCRRRRRMTEGGR